MLCHMLVMFFYFKYEIILDFTTSVKNMDSEKVSFIIIFNP